MLIGLAGKMQTGKDTIGNYLRKKYDFSRVASADYLKEVAEKLGWDGKKDKRGREFLQKLGTECVREYNPDFWIEHTFNKINKMQKRDKSCRIVISDVRFLNECKKIKEHGGTLIKVIRNTKIKSNHVSETEVDKFKAGFIIENNSSFNALYSKINLILKQLNINEK